MSEPPPTAGEPRSGSSIVTADAKLARVPHHPNARTAVDERIALGRVLSAVSQPTDPQPQPPSVHLYAPSVCLPVACTLAVSRGSVERRPSFGPLRSCERVTAECTVVLPNECGCGWVAGIVLRGSVGSVILYCSGIYEYSTGDLY